MEKYLCCIQVLLGRFHFPTQWQLSDKSKGNRSSKPWNTFYNMHVAIGPVFTFVCHVSVRRLVHQQFLWLSELLWYDGEFSQSEMHFSSYTSAAWMCFKCDFQHERHEVMTSRQHDDVGTTPTQWYQPRWINCMTGDRKNIYFWFWGDSLIHPLLIPRYSESVWTLHVWLRSFEDLWHEIQPLRGLINRCNVTKQVLNMSLQVNDLLTDKRIISYPL